MRLLIIGATGRTGRLLVREALERGHEVTALVRAGADLTPHAALDVVVADPLDPATLAVCAADQDAVLSVLGQVRGGDRRLLRDAGRAAVTALGAAGPGRYIVLSQGLLFPTRNPLILLLRRLLARQVADSAAMEALVRGSALAWTIVRPPRLTLGGPAKGYRVARDARPPGTSMQRVDLAAFLVDEAEAARHPRAVVGVS